MQLQEFMYYSVLQRNIHTQLQILIFIYVISVKSERVPFAIAESLFVI